MKNKQFKCIHGFAICAITLLLLTSATIGQTTIVFEGFVGPSSDPLNGTSADVFDPNITGVGGSDTWVAGTASQFNADGSITPFSTFDSIAYLDMGTYIEDTKGTPEGIFELGLTIGQTTNSGNWVGLGFTQVIPGGTAEMYFIPDADLGVAWAGYNRDPSVAFFYAGAGLTNAPSTPSIALGPGDHDFAVLLDLSTYDGVTDFGSVSYWVDGVPVVGGTFSYTEANTFRTISMALDNGANGTVSNFYLTQVPEPAALSLVGFGIVMLLRRKHMV